MLGRYDLGFADSVRKLINNLSADVQKFANMLHSVRVFEAWG